MTIDSATPEGPPVHFVVSVEYVRSRTPVSGAVTLSGETLWNCHSGPTALSLWLS